MASSGDHAPISGNLGQFLTPTITQPGAGEPFSAAQNGGFLDDLNSAGLGFSTNAFMFGQNSGYSFTYPNTAMGMQGGSANSIQGDILATAVQTVIKELQPYLGRMQEELLKDLTLSLTAKMDNLRLELKDMVEDAADAKESELRDPALVSAVHYYMVHLLGCPLKTAKGPSGRPYYDLPKPLADGDEIRKAGDGTRLWNPDWHADVDIGVNVDFIQAVVEIVVANGSKTHHVQIEETPRSRVEDYAKTYFCTLKGQYLARTMEEGRAKLMKKNLKEAVRQRKKRKAGKMRTAIPAFQAQYGEAQTVGLEALVQTDWQSSEHSDYGAATTEEWMKCCDSTFAGASAVEQRRLAWCSMLLNRIYACLRMLAVKEGSGSGVRYGRFRGPSVNFNLDPPKMKKPRKRDGKQVEQMRPTRECMSEKWAKLSPSNWDIFNSTSPADGALTIFTLVIPDGDLATADLTWVGDVELDQSA